MPTKLSQKQSVKQVVVVNVNTNKRRRRRTKKKGSNYSVGSSISSSISTNSAFTNAWTPNRPYIPAITYIQSPYNNGVVPDNVAMEKDRQIQTLTHMTKQLDLDKKYLELDNVLLKKSGHTIKELKQMRDFAGQQGESGVITIKPNTQVEITPYDQPSTSKGFVGLRNINTETSYTNPLYQPSPSPSPPPPPPPATRVKREMTIGEDGSTSIKDKTKPILK